jgi:endonuclease YncB( thermonuclease family)
MRGSALALLLACGSAVHAQPVESRALRGEVVRVTDGDTVWVRPDGRKPVKVRLVGIDAPERCQAWGVQAREALAARVLNRRVEVNARAHDDYGRTLGTLRLQGEDIEAWMVLQGHAWSYRHRRSAGPYAEQEAAARRGGRGLFADANAIEPRTFRHIHGMCR